MNRSRLGMIVTICSAALAWLITVPDRIFATVLAAWPKLAAMPRLVASGPTFAFDGPADASIDPALAHDQRHEAGLARLGAVRHS